MTTKSSTTQVESHGNFELINNYQDLARYSGQIVAVEGAYYFTNAKHAFSFSENSVRFAYVSSQINNQFENGEGYYLNTLYKTDAVESSTIANKSTLQGRTLYVRVASEDELKQIKSVIKASSAHFSDRDDPEDKTGPKEAWAILERV